jgi:hypothetical protein
MKKKITKIPISKSVKKFITYFFFFFLKKVQGYFENFDQMVEIEKKLKDKYYELTLFKV